ncbi:MAG TPA: nucleotide pyrophosphatase, partial [Candidatus Bathyarchaeota archaeon]|nr:nucleotide pyrophosphatase [Candidatus Bathyarchaeota archaeon]
MRRVLVAGLDCAAPSLMFDRFLEDLPNVKSLIKSGVYGRLRSCDPPITVPAWMVMATGRSPGSLGLYGFRYRRYGEYRKFSIASSKSILAPKVWDVVARHGGKSCVFAVPPSYPPTRVEGCLVSCFLTPSSKVDYTYPSDLKPELEEAAGEYVPDVLFRTEEKERLLGELWDMTEQHMKAIMYLLENKQWDFFMFVEIGLDRVQHAFWKYFDETHHLHVPDSKFKTVVRDYYAMLDRFLGEILNALDRDTVLLVTSDHGAKAMKGAFSVNDWLMRMGYLKVKGRPEPGVRIGEAEVDWEKTVAWGWGGYYARIFLNVEG